MIAQLILAVSVVFSIGAGINFFLSIGSAETAPQQAAVAAIALATAGIPYMVARAVSDSALQSKVDRLLRAQPGQPTPEPAEWGWLGYVVLGLIVAVMAGMWISKLV